MTSAADQTVTRPQLWKGVRFDNAEYVERLARFQANLARQDVGVAVVADERTTWYLTGFGDVTPIGSRARPRIVVVPAEGDPTFFVHESTATTVREMTWFDDVRTYEPLGQAPVNEIAARVREAAALRVGLELGGQLRPELTVTEIWRLGELLAPAEVVDVSPAVWATRFVKSTAEADRLRRACALTACAYERVFDSLHEGMTEHEVKKAVAAELYAAGADAAWSIAVVGRGDYGRVDGVPRHRPAARGDLVFIDCGANVGGYWADFSRGGVIGRPDGEQRAYQEQIAEATRAGVEAIRPGGTLGDVARAAGGVMQRYGLEFSSRAGRIGHGFGLLVTEPPDVAAHSELQIQPGMALTVEPGVIRQCGIFHCEENVLVTESGCEVLSLAPWELRTLR